MTLNFLSLNLTIFKPTSAQKLNNQVVNSPNNHNKKTTKTIEV